MSKRDAVAAVAVYFESIGARPEQALFEAHKWLKAPVFRSAAKAAISTHRAAMACFPRENAAGSGNKQADQIKLHALYAIAAHGSDKIKREQLPTCMMPSRRKRPEQPSARLKRLQKLSDNWSGAFR